MVKPTKKTAKTSKKTTKKPIADVAKAGSSAPTNTSKPVLITNRPLLQDPMVVTEPSDESGTIIEVKKVLKPKLQPLSAPLPPEADSADNETASPQDDQPAASDEAKNTPDESNVVEPAETAAAESEAAPDETAKASEATADDTEAEDEAEPETKPKAAVADKPATEPDEPRVTDNAAKDKLADDEAKLAEQAAHDDKVEKLIEGKQYFLPINAVEKRKSQHFVILGLVLSIVLLAAWADIALDAGLVQIGNVKPVTHFFSK